MTPVLGILLAGCLAAGTPRTISAQAFAAAPHRPASETALSRAEPPDRSPDRWFAEDKLKHFFMSLAATNIAYGAARTAGADGRPALVIAGSAAGAAGLWKEWRDRRRGDRFSTKDLVWDAAGIAAGLVLGSLAR